MKFPVKTAAVIVVLGIGAAAFPFARAWWKARNEPKYRQAEVTRGEIVTAVNATGTIQPVLRVQIGSVVSGPIRSPRGVAESLSADTAGTQIAASYDRSSGVLKLSGEDTVAAYQRVLRSVVYDNTAETPNTTPRVITFVASDGAGDSNVGTTTVTIAGREAAVAAEPSAGPARDPAPPRSQTTPAAFVAEKKRSARAALPVTHDDELPAAAVEDENPSGETDVSAPSLDLDGDDSSGRSGADFAATFTQGGPAVPVADADATLSGPDNPGITSLTITLTNVLDNGKLAYYNQEVKRDELLAEIDPRIYDAAVARDRATLNTRLAEVDRVRALLKQADAEQTRARELQKMERQYREQTAMKEVKFISDTELDQIAANRASLEAQLKIALANVEQARGNLENSVVNLGYTKITSPVDGVVIDRKIDEGQTLAAQFQTPEMFVVAPNMRQQMHVIASVDEADIGLIRKAEGEQRPVQFTVDAYPDDVFEGKIFQVRMNPTTVQNVVTYPVVVEVANPELKLLPGMTANLSFEIARHDDVVRIPNAALRFYPTLEAVRQEDRRLLESFVEETATAEEEGNESAIEQQPAAARAEANRTRNQRHVWVKDGDFLRAVAVTTGANDYKWTELVTGDLKEGQELITGEAPPEP